MSDSTNDTTLATSIDIAIMKRDVQGLTKAQAEFKEDMKTLKIEILEVIHRMEKEQSDTNEALIKQIDALKKGFWIAIGAVLAVQFIVPLLWHK